VIEVFPHYMSLPSSEPNVLDRHLKKRKKAKET
jgi:hypothetical protein